MTKLKTISTVAIAILISTSAWAAEDGDKQVSPKMPMTMGGDGKMMMDPQMMQNMMPMMNMQMMYQMMQQMNAMKRGRDHDQGCGDKHGMPAMGAGMGNMMMNPQMMQMRMQHMTNMEQRLKSIESLLSQLVELQKVK